LIEDTVHKSEEGSQISVVVAGRMTVITTHAHELNQLVGEISQACGQQSQWIHQIKQAVSQIESVTQSTAHNAERTATAAACLKNNPKR
jgi:methyl-accepting chemotaxis protein